MQDPKNRFAVKNRIWKKIKEVAESWGRFYKKLFLLTKYIREGRVLWSSDKCTQLWRQSPTGTNYGEDVKEEKKANRKNMDRSTNPIHGKVFFSVVIFFFFSSSSHTRFSFLGCN